MQKARGHTEKRRSVSHRAPTACRQSVSGTISLPSPGCFSPFPHGTGSLSVAKEYLALGDGPPKFPRGSTCPVVLGCSIQEVRWVSPTDCHPLWCDFPDASTTKRIGNFPTVPEYRPIKSRDPACTTLPGLTCTRFGLFPFRSPLLWKSRLFSFPEDTKMFQFPSFASYAYVFSVRCSGIGRSGLPHSEISGSKLVSSSPKLIAAYHVFHRLLAPRHPPTALNSLATK